MSEANLKLHVYVPGMVQTPSDASKDGKTSMIITFQSHRFRSVCLPAPLAFGKLGVLSGVSSEQ